MKVAVAGAGWSGLLLACKLSEYEDVEVYEPNRKPKAVCACGIPTSFFSELARDYGLKPENYILWKPNSLIMDFNGKMTVTVKVGDLCTFDKQAFMDDLYSICDAKFHFRKHFPLSKISDYDLVVDATGIRAILGKNSDDRYYITYQEKVRFKELPCDGLYFQFINPEEKYLWLFPLSENEAYVGAASTIKVNNAVERVRHFLKKFHHTTLQRQAKLLRCDYKNLPIVKGKIVGVGNSIDAITSLGEGNQPSAQTVKILLENLYDLNQYERQVRKELSWIKHDHAAYNAWAKNQKIRTFYHMLKLRKIYRERFKASFDIRLLMVNLLDNLDYFGLLPRIHRLNCSGKRSLRSNPKIFHG